MARSEVNYEVHVQQKGRWEIHARYKNSGRDPAIEEAKVLDQLPYIESVRVIRESYDPDEGMSIETIVYQSSRGAAALRADNASSALPGSDGSSPEDFWTNTDNDEDLDEGVYEDDDTFKLKGKVSLWPKSKKKKKAPQPPQPTSTFGTALIKIILILLISTTVAVLVTLVGLVTIKDLPFFRFSSSNSVKTIILIAMFMTSFLAAAVPLTKSFLAKTKLAKARNSRPAGGAFFGEALKTAPIDAPPAPAEPNPAPAEPDPETGISKEAMEAAEATEKALEDWKKEKESTEEEPPNSSAKLSPHGEKQKALLMRFLGNGLEKMPDASRKLDSFNKFGVNLFLSGACEILSQKQNLDGPTTQAILCESVQVMGFKKGDAERFAEKYEEYLLNDSRYMQMFQAGRNAMNSYFTDESASAKHMEHAMAEWNKPKQKEENIGPVTVLFTDMVGSTALTQSRGDAAAQEVVRAHNRIVREALTRFGGKEVKHTGDGIMASFSTTSNSVEASILIQEEVEKHNLKNTDLPLHIKIGINAGEPIAEDNDLFGTTVQLAARIVDKAQSEEIFVSEIVRGICAGKDITFTSRGLYTMKGFPEDLTLYEVVWRKQAEA